MGIMDTKTKENQNDKFEDISFKSMKNTRVFCHKNKDGIISIWVRRIVAYDELENFDYFKVVRRFSTCCLVDLGASFLPETFWKIILFSICETKSQLNINLSLLHENKLNICLSRDSEQDIKN